MDEKLRIQKLAEVFYAVYHGKYGLQVINQNQEYIDQVQPSDIVRVVDMLVRNNIPMAGLRTGINKFLSILYKPLVSREIRLPSEGGLLDICLKNNRELLEQLKAIRPLIKSVNRDPRLAETREALHRQFAVLENVGNYYLIKENVLFPLLEKRWKDYRCLGVMWSYHDMVRKDLMLISQLLEEDVMDLTRFNRKAGDIFFNMYALCFREERILFPVIMDTIPEEQLNELLPECLEIGFPYFNPKLPETEKEGSGQRFAGEVDLKTGHLTPEQIMLVFNHLPVDITYVDENDQVKYFSNPPDRIFPRSAGVIGRDVRNCHPPESIHVVEQILESFRKGERESATFWIDLKEEKVLIQYFACRDRRGKYKGVVEVSQVITTMQSLTGEKRLLDWNS